MLMRATVATPADVVAPTLVNKPVYHQPAQCCLGINQNVDAELLDPGGDPGFKDDFLLEPILVTGTLGLQVGGICHLMIQSSKRLSISYFLTSLVAEESL